MDGFLVQDHALDELGVVDGTALLLDNLDVVHVDDEAGAPLLGDRPDRLHGDVREHFAGLVGDLGAERGRGDTLQLLGVLGGDLERVLLQNLQGLLGRHPEARRYDRRVHVGVQKLLCLLQQLSRQHDGGGGPVAALGVLGLGHLHQHLGRGVFHVDLLEDGHTVVGDDHVAHGVDEHLVHAAGAQGAPDGVRDGLRRRDVVLVGALALLTARSLLEDEYRGLSSHHFPFLH